MKEIVIRIVVTDEATDEQIDAFVAAARVQAEDVVAENGASLGDLPVQVFEAEMWEDCDRCDNRYPEKCGKCRGHGRQRRTL